MYDVFVYPPREEAFPRVVVILVILVLLVKLIWVVLPKAAPAIGLPRGPLIVQIKVPLEFCKFFVVAGPVGLDKSLITLFFFLAHPSPLHAHHFHEFAHHNLWVLFLHALTHFLEVDLEPGERTFWGRC
jgi:hypothetical protein